MTKFSAAYLPAKGPLEAWKTLIEKNTFKHLVHLKQTFGSADYDSPDTIFDIGGNKYRIIAVVNYQAQVVFVKRVMTHAQYDAWCQSKRKKK